MMKRSISSRVGELRPTAVNRVLEEVRRYEATGRKTVSLMRGQPDWPTAKHIVEAAEAALREGRTGYANNQGELGLRQAVAAKIAREQGLSYDPATEVLITDGATCGIFVALAAVLEPGDEVLVPDPIYDAYAGPIALCGGRAVAVSAAVREGRFAIECEALQKACSAKARALLLNDPWNPVGTAFRAEELQPIVDFAAERDLVLISDEIYESLVYDGRKHFSGAALVGARARTIVVNSLSKTYAMTGWRVGYCAAPAEVVRAMLLVLQQFSRGPATFVQDAAVCALESSQDDVAKMRAEFQGRRDFVVERLEGIVGVKAMVPDAGLFVMVDLRGLQSEKGRPRFTSDEVRRFLLDKYGVVVIHGGAYGAGGEGLLRVSFAGGGEALDKGVSLLREGLCEVASGDWWEGRE